MNTYQSPYIDGQVVEPESATGRSEEPLPVPQADTKIGGCTKSASDCLHKTTKLAREFNHGTVSAAHLILAMTLIPNASRQFELRKMDIDRAFRAAMQALMEIERGSPSKGGLPGLSEEFNVIVTLAQELAQNRDNQEVSVDDLLTALDRLPEDSSAAQLIRGERKSTANAPDMQQALDQMSLAINQQFQDIRHQIAIVERRAVAPIGDFIVGGAVNIMKDRTWQALLGELAKIRNVATVIQPHEHRRHLPICTGAHLRLFHGLFGRRVNADKFRRKAESTRHHHG